MLANAAAGAHRSRELTSQVSTWLRELGDLSPPSSNPTDAPQLPGEADGWNLSPSVVERWCVGDGALPGATAATQPSGRSSTPGRLTSSLDAAGIDPVTPESPALLLWQPPELPPRGGDSEGPDLPTLAWAGASDPASWLPIMQRWQHQQHVQQLEIQEIQRREAALTAQRDESDGLTVLRNDPRASKRPKHAAAPSTTIESGSTTPDIVDGPPTPRAAKAAEPLQQQTTPKRYRCPLDGCGRCFSTSTGLHTHTGWHRRKTLTDSGAYEERAHPCKKTVNVMGSDGTITAKPIFCCAQDGCAREFPSRAALATHAGWHRRQRSASASPHAEV